MEFYQRLAEAMEEDEIMEITDELVDRFGTPPRPVENPCIFQRFVCWPRSLVPRALLLKRTC